MCHKGTILPPLRSVILALALAGLAAAQSATWRKVGSSAVELMLASPATGPVENVWFSRDGGILYARTRSGKVFETADYEIWQPSSSAAEPATLTPAPAVARIPEPGSRVVGGSFGRIYALGRQLFRSDDGGRSWESLSAFKTDSVIGVQQHSVATSPASADQIVVANDFGVWRSMDGGLSWAGLNLLLPNLPVKRILSAPTGASGTRVVVDGMGPMELPPGATVWQPVNDPTQAVDEAQRILYSQKAGGEVRSYAVADKVVYVGTADGRILISRDGGLSFSQTNTDRANGPVERLFVDQTRPEVALAALGGPNAPHILRTTNSGGFWDALDANSNLPNVPVRAVTGERAAGAVYVATDRGVFWAKVDLDNASTTPANWIPLTGLPQAAASDVYLDPSGIQLYTAVEGYGVYATAAPHRLRSVRLVNAADFSTRAAAPGSLMSVIGGRVNAVRGGDLDYPILASADDASQIQVPFEAVGPNVTLALQTSTGAVRLGMQVQPVSPAIFISRDGAPMLQDADTGLLLDARKTAHAGSRIQVFATGLGKVTPDWPSGTPARVDNPPAVAATIRAFLNGAPVPVRSATLAGGYIGFYVVELQLPTLNNAGPAELYITADGVESNRVQITIDQ
uniref:Glycosyl hydrolase, BNR repeat-containing protein n=1 Tax=Solibacter usitatus (strain Ellin6076) TaxID=234267 RepID=Q01SS6_SOLUE